jgi:hypothetical protein
MIRRFQLALRGLLDAIGYEPEHRKVWIVAYVAAALAIACCAFLAYVVQRASNPGQDHYAKVEQLKADFDSVHGIPAANLFSKLRGPLGPLCKSRSVFAATRGRGRTSLYLQDVFGEFWKVTPDRFFGPMPPLATRTQLRYWDSNGVLSGRWDIRGGSILPPGASTGVSDDEFSVVLDDRNRMN